MQLLVLAEQKCLEHQLLQAEQRDKLVAVTSLHMAPVSLSPTQAAAQIIWAKTEDFDNSVAWLTVSERRRPRKPIPIALV